MMRYCDLNILNSERDNLMVDKDCIRASNYSINEKTKSLSASKFCINQRQKLHMR